MDSQTVKVWDLTVRIFHWSLLASFIVAYLSEDEGDLHAYAGYAVLALLVFRLGWGFIGPEHARFSNFIYSPGKVLEYLRSMVSRNPQHYLGHNPASGWMIVALLLSLCFVVFTGLKTYGAEGHGPLANMSLPSLITVTYADDDDDDDDDDGDEYDDEHEKKERAGRNRRRSHEGRGERRERHRGENEAEEYWEELHEISVNFTLLLVLIHILGVITASLLHHENLIKAMITGNKATKAS